MLTYFYFKRGKNMGKGFTYKLKIDAEIQSLLDKTAKIKESMKSFMDAGKAPGAEKMFSNIERALTKL
jgi:hypothetical protein